LGGWLASEFLHSLFRIASIPHDPGKLTELGGEVLSGSLLNALVGWLAWFVLCPDDNVPFWPD